jgi:hypothetical protein
MPEYDVGWMAAAGYLYVLHLDVTALAWEYLRRNSEYRHCWSNLGRLTPPDEVQTWGLRFRRRS